MPRDRRPEPLPSEEFWPVRAGRQPPRFVFAQDNSTVEIRCIPVPWRAEGLVVLSRLLARFVAGLVRRFKITITKDEADRIAHSYEIELQRCIPFEV